MKIAQVFFLIFLVFSFLTGPLFAESKRKNPIEVGDVDWGRDFKGALKTSRESGKPIFLLFQEVPGCIGCQNFGQHVLTHPLLVEAIEDLFIPVLVYNNRFGGKDAEILELFGEPSWNFQVIRFIDGSGKDIIPRKDKIWSVSKVAARMIRVLEAVGEEIPLYLQTVALETDVDRLGLVGFSMACFWVGEYKLGKIDGVVSTEAGWYDHREVTLVRYHKEIINLSQLVEHAAKERCAQAVYLTEEVQLDRSRFPVKGLDLKEYRTAAEDDQKKQLQGWLQRQQGLQLTQMQLMKLNALIPDNIQNALKWISPRQLQQVK